MIDSKGAEQTLRRMRSDMRRTARCMQKPPELRLPEVLSLNPPPILPGEPWPDSARTVHLHGGMVSLASGRTLFYGPDGEPLVGGFTDVMAYVAEIHDSPAGHFISRPMYRAGVRIVVSTVYGGIDIGAGAALPMTWETMIFEGGQRGDRMGMPRWEVWRYATTAAARAGHALVVSTIRDGQRARRRAARITAPRRGRGRGDET